MQKHFIETFGKSTSLFGMPVLPIIVFSNLKLRLKGPKMKQSLFANSIDPDEAAHHELLHLDLHCLTFKSLNSQMRKTFFETLQIMKCIFFTCFFGALRVKII